MRVSSYPDSGWFAYLRATSVQYSIEVKAQRTWGRGRGWAGREAPGEAPRGEKEGKSAFPANQIPALAQAYHAQLGLKDDYISI